MGLYLTIFAGVILLISSRTMFVCLSVLLYLCLCVPVLDYCWCYPVDYCIKFQVSSIYIYLTVPFSLNICICLSIYLCLPVLDYCWGYPVDYFQIQVCLQGWRYHLSPFCTAENKKNINKSLSTLFHNVYRRQLID